MAGSTVPEELRRAVGRRVQRVSRVLFEMDVEDSENDGPLELQFENGEVLVLDGASDGETLKVMSEPWKDPFAEPPSAENRPFTASHGAWRKRDVSHLAPYSFAVGKPVDKVVLLYNQFGRVGGVRLVLGGFELWFYVAGDESRVVATPTPGIDGWSESVIA